MKRVAFFAIIIASLFIIYNLSRSIVTLWQKRELLSEAQSELTLEKKENGELKHKLKEAEGEEFIEREARNKLFMAKPGESSIVLDETLTRSLVATKSAGKKEDTRPYFQRWLELFF